MSGADCPSGPARLSYALARIAAGENEARALDLLDGLDAVGAQRALPRLRLASLAEQVMLHSRRYRAESCRGLMARIEALLAAEGPSRGRLWRATAETYRDLAEGYAAIAARDWRAARAPFERANGARGPPTAIGSISRRWVSAR